MTEREIEAAFLIIEGSIIADEEPTDEVLSQAVKVVCQLFIDIHRIAEAAEYICKGLQSPVRKGI